MGKRSTLTVLVSAAMMLGAMFLVLLAEGCSSTSPSTPTSNSSGTDNKPYGSLTIASSFSGHLDPQIASALAFEDIGAAVFDSLLSPKADGQRGPGVAERWEISADGKTHTFYLRKGIKFHNGDDLTAADVKFSIERMMKPESIASNAAGFRASIASVEIKDDYTVALNMKTPQFLLLSYIEAQMGAIFPKKYIEEKGEAYFRENFVGSGPFKVVSYIPGTKLELEALDSHWRITPKFKKVTLLAVPEESTKVAMLKTGELDAALIATDSVTGLKSAGLRVQSYSGGAQYFGNMFYDMENPDKYAIGDVRVRKAMKLAINAKEMIDGLFGGAATPFYVFPVSPNASFFDPNVLKLDPVDPEGARKLLAEAGYPNGFSHTLVDVLRGAELSNIDVAVQGYWRKIGINTEIAPIEYSVNRSLYNPKHNPKVWNTSLIMLATEDIEFEKMASNHHSKQSGFKNINIPKLDQLIEGVAATADPAKRTQMMAEAASLVKNNYSTFSVLAPNVTMAVGSKVGEVPPYRSSRLVANQLATLTHAK